MKFSQPSADFYAPRGQDPLANLATTTHLGIGAHADDLEILAFPGIATCFQIGNGQALFGPVRIENAGDYFASPVSGDGKIFVASENGKIVVLKDSPELEVLAVNDLGDSILGTPAIAEGALFVRTRKSLLKIQ